MQKSGSLLRTIRYGDYGMQNPELSESGGNSGKANLRYTIENEWAIFRGGMIDMREPTKTIAALMKSLCKKARCHDFFCGRDFSSADEYIDDCGIEAQTPSNSATFWKQVGFTHHITFVSHQSLQD